jgi:tetratricopeptide (TPR) repeat protein
VAGAGYDALVADNDELAKRWLRAAVRMDSKDAASWFNLGLALSNLGDEPAALRAFEEAVALNPLEKDFQDALRELRDSSGAEPSTNQSDSTTIPSE